MEIKPEMERERQKPVKLVTGICFLMEIDFKTYNPRKFNRLSGTQFGMAVQVSDIFDSSINVSQ